MMIVKETILKQKKGVKMPVPFINKHSEEQYLKLEQAYFNLYNFIESLLTVTEGEDLNSDSQRLSHFNVLCKRINEGLSRFNKTTKQVRVAKLNGNSTTTPQAPESAEVVIYCTKKERDLIVEALDNSALMLDDLKISDQFKLLSIDIKKSKGE